MKHSVFPMTKVCCLLLSLLMLLSVCPVLAAEESIELLLSTAEGEYAKTWNANNYSYRSMQVYSMEAGQSVTYTDQLEVPADGTYTLTLYGRCQGGEGQFVLSVGGKQISAVDLAKGQDISGANIGRYDLGEAELTAGSYPISLVCTAKGTLALGKLVLAPKQSLPQPETKPTVEDLYFEGESTPFTTTDSTKKTTAVKGENAWAWSLNLSGAANVSGQLCYFRSGGIGGTVDYTVDVENAGEYSLIWAYRPNEESYSTVQVLVDGVAEGGVISQKSGMTVGGKPNQSNTVREVVLGNVLLTAGSHTVTFQMTEGGIDDAHSALTVDYIRLSAPVDETKLTFTEAPIAPEDIPPAPATKENSKPITVEIPDGMLDILPGVSATPKTTDKITVYPLAKCYSKESRYTLTVDGVEVPVTSVGGNYDYASFDYDPAKGSIELTVHCRESVNSLLVSPQHIAPTAKKSGNTVTATLTENRTYCFAINGRYLLISADPMEKDVPADSGEGIFNVTAAPYSVTADMSDAARTAAIQKALDDAAAYGSVKGNKNGVVYIPAGVYTVGNLYIGSNTHLYLAGGAALQITEDKSLLRIDGCKTSMALPNGGFGLDYTWWISTAFTADGQEVEGSYDIRISGRGTIDGGGMEFWRNTALGNNTLVPIACSYFTCEGITVREGVCWSVVPVRSDHVAFDWVKFYQRTDMGENDGIDVCECQHVTVTNCTGLALDDPFTTKAWPYQTGITVNWPGVPEYVDDVLFENCMSYTHCYGFKVGQGTDQNQYNVRFVSCTVLDAAVGLGVHCKSGGGTIYDVLFKDCYVEKLHGNNDGHSSWFIAYTQHNSRGDGNIRGVLLKDIHVYNGAAGTNAVELIGYNDQSGIDGIIFANIYFNGKLAESMDDLLPKVTQNEFAVNIKLDNQATEEKPPVSEDQPTPDAPDSSDTPDRPGTDKPTDGPADPDNGDRGGSVLPIVLIAVAGVSAAAVAILLILRKKQ